MVIAEKISPIVLAFFIITSCDCNRSIPVSPEEYARYGKCWKNKSEKMSAFIAIVETKYGYIPYLISSKCYSTIPGNNDKVAFLLSTGSINLTDSDGVMQNYMKFKMPLINSNITDTNPVESFSDIYYIISDVNIVNDGFGEYINISSIDTVKNINMKYGDLIELTPDERMEIASAIDKNI